MDTQKKSTAKKNRLDQYTSKLDSVSMDMKLQLIHQWITQKIITHKQFKEILLYIGLLEKPLKEKKDTFPAFFNYS